MTYSHTLKLCTERTYIYGVLYLYSRLDFGKIAALHIDIQSIQIRTLREILLLHPSGDCFCCGHSRHCPLSKP